MIAELLFPRLCRYLECIANAQYEEGKSEINFNINVFVISI